MNFEFLNSFPIRVAEKKEIIGKYKKIFKNYRAVFTNVMFQRYPIIGILLSGEVVKIESYAELTMMTLGIKFVDYDVSHDATEFEVNGKRYRMIGLQYGGDLSTFVNPYSLDVYDKVVIDIGANIGDTALSFVNKGARTVIAIEAYPFTFELLKANIEMNGLQGKVIPFNAVVSDKLGFIRLNCSERKTTGRNVQESNTGKDVTSITVRQIIESFGLSEGVLKMDCEGCEYKSLLSTEQEYLETFDQFGIEYHYGAELLEKLFTSIGYSVRADKPRSRYNTESRTVMQCGMIYAKRV